MSTEETKLVSNDEARAMDGTYGSLAGVAGEDVRRLCATVIHLRLHVVLALEMERDRVTAERDEARADLARRDAEYLELAQRMDGRGAELRAAHVAEHTARRDLNETRRRVRAALSRLGVADCDDVCAALDEVVSDVERREREAVDEANALRMERDIAQRECSEWREETAARHAEVCALLPGDPAQWTSVDVAYALVKSREECDALHDARNVLSDEVERLTRDNARLQRACDEGLPREVIPCPACGTPHVDGASGVEFATRPHHTHRCETCTHVWDAQRWSFGVAPGKAMQDARDAALRTTAPTDAEIASHAAAGGAWLVRAEWRTGRQSIDFVQSWAPQIAGLLRDKCNATWWMALDSAHMPCAWPVVDGGPDAAR